MKEAGVILTDKNSRLFFSSIYRLNQCEDEWWKTVSNEYTLEMEASQDYNDTQQLLLTDTQENEEPMIDLQANEEPIMDLQESPSLLGDDDSSDDEV